jgi:hypothetical protein
VVPSLTVTVSPAFSRVALPPLVTIAEAVVNAELLVPVTVTSDWEYCSAWLATVCAELSRDLMAAMPLKTPWRILRKLVSNQALIGKEVLTLEMAPLHGLRGVPGLRHPPQPG